MLSWLALARLTSFLESVARLGMLRPALVGGPSFLLSFYFSLGWMSLMAIEVVFSFSLEMRSCEAIGL